MEAGHGSIPSDVGVGWLNSKGSWSFYVLVLVFAHVVLSAVVTPRYATISLVNIGHSAVTFVFFHWIKGSPFSTHFSLVPAASEFLTFWEQIDARRQNTPSRKFLHLIVVALYISTLLATPWEYTWWQLANFAAFAVAFIAKMPMMDTVRIFGINK